MNRENLGPVEFDRLGRLLNSDRVADNLDLVGVDRATILKKNSPSRGGWPRDRQHAQCKQPDPKDRYEVVSPAMPVLAMHGVYCTSVT